MLSNIRDDITDVKDSVNKIESGQQKVVWWVASALSSFVVGGALGWLFQK